MPDRRLPLHYNVEHAQPNTVLFIIYFCIISHLIFILNLIFSRPNLGSKKVSSIHLSVVRIQPR